MEVFLACASVDFVALMDQTMLAVSLPIIRYSKDHPAYPFCPEPSGILTKFSASLQAGSLTSWIANGYFVSVPPCTTDVSVLADANRTSTSFQLVYGRLSDIWSTKLVLLSGLLIFFLGSLASSLSENALQLVIFRAITGVGGGGLMTIAQVIVSDVVTLKERGKYQGILVSMSETGGRKDCEPLTRCIINRVR